MQQRQFAQAADLLRNLHSLFPANPILERDYQAAQSALDKGSEVTGAAAEASAVKPCIAGPRAADALQCSSSNQLFVDRLAVRSRRYSGAGAGLRRWRRLEVLAQWGADIQAICAAARDPASGCNVGSRRAGNRGPGGNADRKATAAGLATTIDSKTSAVKTACTTATATQTPATANTAPVPAKGNPQPEPPPERVFRSFVPPAAKQTVSPRQPPALPLTPEPVVVVSAEMIATLSADLLKPINVSASGRRPPRPRRSQPPP